MTFWRPWLAHWFGLRPGDIGDLTPSQLLGCVKFVDRPAQ